MSDTMYTTYVMPPDLSDEEAEAEKRRQDKWKERFGVEQDTLAILRQLDRIEELLRTPRQITVNVTTADATMNIHETALKIAAKIRELAG